MTPARLDPRVHAFRPDLADARLRGRIDAARFVDGRPMRVRVAATPLRVRPDEGAAYGSELLLGELVRVFAAGDDGWSWCQNEADGYVGYVASAALGPPEPAPGHRVTALRTFVYPGPDMKLPPMAFLSLGAGLSLEGSAETRGTRFHLLAGSGEAVVARHIAPLDAPPVPDFVAVAERFRDVPYLWGGRTSVGLDCSALVQISLMAAGIRAARDSDMQGESIGTPVPGGLDGPLRRGDLVFWPGHVAILQSPDRIVHASGHHMMVVSEPLADAVARIGPPVAIRRP